MCRGDVISCIGRLIGTLIFQLDEYHDRLEDFPEEDEDINSDDDNNSAPPITKIVPNKLQGKPFKMEVMDF